MKLLLILLLLVGTVSGSDIQFFNFGNAATQEQCYDITFSNPSITGRWSVGFRRSNLNPPHILVSYMGTEWKFLQAVELNIYTNSGITQVVLPFADVQHREDMLYVYEEIDIEITPAFLAFLLAADEVDYQIVYAPDYQVLESYSNKLTYNDLTALQEFFSIEHEE